MNTINTLLQNLQDLRKEDNVNADNQNSVAS